MQGHQNEVAVDFAEPVRRISGTKRKSPLAAACAWTPSIAGCRSSAAKPVDLAAVAFGRPALAGIFDPRRVPSLLGNFLALLAALFGFAIQGLGDRRRPADFAKAEHLDLEDAGGIFDAQQLADTDLAGGLAGLAVGLDAAEFAGARGNGRADTLIGSYHDEDRVRAFHLCVHLSRRDSRFGSIRGFHPFRRRLLFRRRGFSGRSAFAGAAWNVSQRARGLGAADRKGKGGGSADAGSVFADGRKQFHPDGGQ